MLKQLVSSVGRTCLRKRPQSTTTFLRHYSRPRHRPRQTNSNHFNSTFAIAAAAASASTFLIFSNVTHLESISSPYIYEELTKGLPQRIQAEQKMLPYLDQWRLDFQRIRIQSRNQEDYALEMALLKEKMLKVHMFITFGVTDPHQRQQYLSQYGCCKWTPRAVQLIKDLTLPLLEIGAGAGLWQKELSNNGIDIKAYDDRSNESLPGNGGTVHVGGIEQINIHSNRTLFLCYPPEGTMALDCLKEYTNGEYLIYIGEGRQGVNGSNAFFDVLEKEWNVVHVDKLDPFPQCFERLYILKRK